MAYCAWLAHLDNYLIEAYNAVPQRVNSSENVAEIGNLIDPNLVVEWQSDDAGDAVLIDIDLGTNRQVDVVAIVRHNFRSTASVLIQASPNGDTSLGSLSAAMTWREFLMFKFFSTALNYRYWRITISDIGNPEGYIEASYLFIGKLTRPTTFSYLYGAQRTTDLMNLEAQSVYGVRFAERKFARETFQLDFGPVINLTEVDLLQDLYENVFGNKYPLLFILDTSVNDAYYVRISNSLEQKRHVQQSTQQRYTKLELIEDSMTGRPED